MSTSCWVVRQGLRSGALLGSRPLHNSRSNTRSGALGKAVCAPCRAVPSGAAPSAARQQAQWRHVCLHGCQETSRHLVWHNSGRSAYGSSPRNRQRNNAMIIAMRPLTQLGCINEAISRFSSVPGVTAKKSVFKKQWIRGVGSRREVRSVKWRLCVRDSVW
jgi:hypothetical protein